MWQKSSLGGGFGKWICFQKSGVFIWKRYLLSLPDIELLLQEALPKTVSVKHVGERLRPLFMFFGTVKLQTNSGWIQVT